MADISIDTTDAAYRMALTRQAQMHALLLPRLRKYSRLSDAGRQAWRNADPLLKAELEWSRKIQAHTEP